MAANPEKKQRTSALLAFLDVDLAAYNSGESSSDESFRIENHKNDSDFDSSGGSDSDEDEDSSDDKSSDEDEPEPESKAENDPAGTGSISAEKLLEQAKLVTPQQLAKPVCCACLGDRSDHTNEIVECDGCKNTVHEMCYGVSDTVSISSTASSCSTEPWFCDACKANVKDPDCELCPNKGGIFKETDCGRWVHLVCVLYVPGVVSPEPDKLINVTLFEMQYNKWGAKTCSLCEDDCLARTGVCIGCDAGMCRSYFHVTCAQKAGLLEHDEHAELDPYLAHCKLHTNKDLIKIRKRNFNVLIAQRKHREAEELLKAGEKPTPEQERINRKLKKQRSKYSTNKYTPWVLTQKMPRLLTSSASACKKLRKKAELMGIDAVALEFQEAQIASLKDIRKKWHIPPAFTTEFVGYYLDRTIRMEEMKTNLKKHVDTNQSLLSQQQTFRVKYDDVIKIKEDMVQHQKTLVGEISEIHSTIQTILPSKHLPAVESIGKPLLTPAAVKMIPQPSTSTLSSTPPPQMISNRTMSVPTAAALKMGVGFPLNNLHKDDTGRVLSTQHALMHECGICKRCTDQHLLAKCDTCQLYYHLGCLNPPLYRHPKRSKIYAWQCSECDKSDESATENMIIPKGPRRSRVRYSKDGPIQPDSRRESIGSEVSISKKSDDHRMMNGGDNLDSSFEVSVPSTPVTPQRKRGRKPKAQKTAESDVKSPESVGPHDSIDQVNNEVENKAAHLNTDPTPMTDVPAAEEKKPSAPAEPTQQFDTIPVTSASLKKGRPKKDKPVKVTNKNTTISRQPKQKAKPLKTKPILIETEEPAVPKEETPLESLQTIADIPYSIPFPIEPVKSVTMVVHETQSAPQIDEFPSFLNGSLLNGESSSSGHHKHKKNKSHKRRHSHSPSSGERLSSSKRHKKKRKRKTRDSDEAPEAHFDVFESERSPIKMKFCAKFVGSEKVMWSSLPQNGSQNSTEPLSSNLNDDITIEPIKSPSTNGHAKSPVVKKRRKPSASPEGKKPKLKSLPPKGISTTATPIIAPSHFTSTPLSSPTLTSAPQSIEEVVKPPVVPPSQKCDVCLTPGTSQNIVKCDECQKNYHFGCLIPPLKKTPKKRGYSWHCADCDPTDHENN